MKPIYESNRKFVLFDALVSHSQVLFRADKIDGANYNSDIIFYETEYISLPSVLNGISICKIESEDRIDSYLNYKSNRKGLSIFEIKSEDKLGYILSFGFAVFSNNLSFSETSLGVLSHKGREKLLVKFPDLLVVI